MHRHLVIPAIAAVVTLAVVTACGGDDAATTTDDASSTSAETAPTTIDASDATDATDATSTPATDARPTTASPGSTTGTTGTTGSTGDSVAPTADGVIVVQTTPAPTRLRDGARYRFRTSGSDLEFDGVTGWSALTTPVNVWMFSAEASAGAWVSVTHLKDARVDLGDDADPTGIAIPDDPYLNEGGMTLPDGTPILANFLPLPDDWFAYLGGIPGITLGEPRPTTVAGVDAMSASYTAAGIAKMSGVCGSGGTPGVMVWAEMASVWCIAEGDTGVIWVLEVDGERYEINAGTNSGAGGTDELRAVVDQIVSSMDVVS